VWRAGGTVTSRTFTIGDRPVDDFGLTENNMAVDGCTGRENTGCGQQKRARNQKQNGGYLPVRQVEVPVFLSK
jgi:hypothetical protein